MTNHDNPGDSRAYRAVEPQVDLPTLDHEILAFWHERGIFDKSLAQTEDAPPWTFYEGPPTANGMPGAHHVEARVFKDLFPRFQTMRGRHVERRAGWDCHGLPVEVATEKELGISGKQQIEDYGIAEFNAACRASVERYVGAFTELTERMGYWVDMSQAYWTMNPAYVESVWWSLKQIFDKGLLVRDYRISPYCPRCGTALSDHELGQPDVYQTVADPSVYVRMPLTSGPLAGTDDKPGAALLVWTTTPWTLVSNTAVAVHPDVDYVAATDGDETLVVAEGLLPVLGEGWEVTARFRGADMERWTYRRPFALVSFPAGADGAVPDTAYVVVDPYVTTEDGTGLVHQAPAFGEDDYRVAKAYGLPVVNPVRPDGTFEPDLALVGGEFFKAADPALVADLDARGVLFRGETYEHSYPHCWRCHTPLLYYALPSWFIRTTAIQDELLAENEGTNWYPDTIKHGRYGEWLRTNVDWALSRNRYWGTPLPIWTCPDGHHTCVGSLAELGELAGRDLSDLDPHRPFVDEVTFACPASVDSASCDATAERVKEVIDAWYDSGAMPFAQWGYPYTEGSREKFAQAYPAQFICEAVDQTRGWFYSLMAVGSLVFARSSYENVVCLGLILAEDGRKMSKHLGNVLEPIPLIERHGADAVRWFMACSGSPWSARRVGDATIQEVVRKVILTYWNSVAFHTLYARLAGWAPACGTPAGGSSRVGGASGAEGGADAVLDRWLRSETHRLVRDVSAAFGHFDTQRIGQLLAAFVDDVSNWYVRRSRRRFWSGDPAALATLHESLELLTRLLAPLTPFVTEHVWQRLVRPVTPDAPESVHLAGWPAADEAAIDDELAGHVTLARRVVELGRAARAEAKVRTRQPLRRALVGATGWTTLPESLRREVAEELNVLDLQGLSDMAGDLVDYAVKPNFRALGKRFGKYTPRIAAAVSSADPGRLVAQLRDQDHAYVDVDGEQVRLDPSEVLTSERPREGWAVANAYGETVALDLTVTDELRRAGTAREIVRLMQEARKNAGLQVSDRIALTWSASDPETAAALREHEAFIADEVLAGQIGEGKPAEADEDLAAGEAENLGLSFWFRRA
ncbi:isoleucine--tRNA ligase [Actinopolymorpha sp. B9G3]|uniref:isoleucine--tRNA ligase n=1 Tax=Actinopolymorpha sp. B9G3 TaxID=3158970 RepID=UPI0032D91946